MPIKKHKHRQILWDEQKNAVKNGIKIEEEKLDRSTLIATNWTFGNEKNDWTTDAQASYIKYDPHAQCSAIVSTSELQNTNLNLGSDKTQYQTTTDSSFTDLVAKPIPQAQRTITKAELQKSRVVLGDGRTRYFELSTK